MEDQLTRLVDKVWDKYLQTPPDRRLLIAIGGIPGSGKTTLATTLVNLLNARHQSTPSSTTQSTPSVPLAAYIPMDGYHLTRHQLSSLPDPSFAHARRGAEFTFDGASFLRLITSLRSPSHSQSPSSSQTIIYAPSFDHALKDPVPNSIPILPLPGHAIVVVEGIYVLLDKEPWREAAGMFDLRVYLRVERDRARERLVGRHVAAGIAQSEEEAEARVRENDLVNGDLVEGWMVRVDVVLDSREDEGWVHG